MMIRRYFFIIMIVSGVIVLYGCMTSMGNRPTTMSAWSASISSPYFGKFEQLWAERTITLTQNRSGAGMGMGSGEGVSFPILVQATFMDSTLIHAGIEEFARLSSMNEEEAARFRTSYEMLHIRGDSIFIWVEMQNNIDGRISSARSLDDVPGQRRWPAG